MFRKVSCLLIIFIFLMNISFAEDYTNFLIKIGLNFNKMSPEIVNINSDDDLCVFFENENSPMKIFDVNKTDLKLSSANYYNLIFEKKYKSVEELQMENKDILNSNKNSYIYYNDGYYIGFGEYGDESSAQKYLTKITGIDKNKLMVLPFHNSVKIYDDNKIYFIYNSGNFDCFVGSSNYPNSGIINYEGDNYRGGIGIKFSNDNNISIVNYLLLDHYIYGVLPKEMPKTWETEALKAQSIVARNFALSNINKHSDLGYNLCSTSNCQVYSGYDGESEITNRMVDETSGEILYYNDQIVNGFYHSNSGGMTESIENVWSSEIPYLKSVEDPYSLGVPSSNWEYSISSAELSRKFVDIGNDIGNVENIVILEKAPTGRVQKLKFVGSKGIEILEKEEVRKFLGYGNIKSTWYDIKGDNTGTILSDSGKQVKNLNLIYGVTSSKTSKVSGADKIFVAGKNKIVVYEDKSENFNFIGYGSGHGVGMSQWGAKKMAEEGFSYKDILYHYYTNTNIRN